MSEKLKAGDRLIDSFGTTVVVLDKYAPGQKHAWYVGIGEERAHYQGVDFRNMLYPILHDVPMQGRYVLCFLDEYEEESNEFGIVSP